jgi:hypothetical protein
VRTPGQPAGAARTQGQPQGQPGQPGAAKPPAAAKPQRPNPADEKKKGERDK